MKPRDFLAASAPRRALRQRPRYEFAVLCNYHASHSCDPRTPCNDRALHLLPRKKKQARCELAARSHPLYAAYIRRGGEIAERHARGAKDEEQFAGPEQNIEQTRALEIRQTLR